MALSNELQQIKEMLHQNKLQGTRYDLPTGEMLQAIRMGNDQMMASFPLPESYAVEPSPFQGVAGEFYRYTGEDKDETRLLYYIHGGGFENGTVGSRRFIAMNIANELRCDCFSLDYTQWPEAEYPVALYQAIAGWGHISRRYGASNVVIAGESGGAVQCLTMTHWLKDHGRELPAKVVAIGPVTNVADDFPSRAANEDADPMLWRNINQQLRYFWSAEDLRSPYVSAYYGDFHNFPPTMVTAGTDEVLYDDAITLYEQLKEAFVETELDVLEGGFHTYQCMPSTEAFTCIARIGAFLRR